MNVPLLDLKAQYNTIKAELDEAVLHVAESQWLVLGSEVATLEERLAEYCNTKYAIGVSSGTDALLMALMALNVGPGDEVIIPDYSFFATAGVVSRLNAKPVFIDSRPDTFNIDPDLIETKINDRTKAIIPVHLYGQCADMDEINEIALKYKIPVIEDGAQAIGAEYHRGRKAGSMGLMGCFSFYPTKNLGCFGDGGLITTNDEDLAIKLKQMRNHGMEPKYHHKFVGGNFRLDAIQAAVLNVKFKYLEDWHRARRFNAAAYVGTFIDTGLSEKQGVSEFDEKNKVLLPVETYKGKDLKNHHIFNQFIIRVKNRDKLREYLADNNIGTEIYYPVPFHGQECFAEIIDPEDEFPVADTLSAETLALPVYPELSVEQIHYVVEKIREFVS